jgi:hypothetical protein
MQRAFVHLKAMDRTFWRFTCLFLILRSKMGHFYGFWKKLADFPARFFQFRNWHHYRVNNPAGRHHSQFPHRFLSEPTLDLEDSIPTMRKQTNQLEISHGDIFNVQI